MIKMFPRAIEVRVQMPTIVNRYEPGGVVTRIDRLGLRPLVEDLERIVTGFDLRVLEERDQNSGGLVRELLDARFEAENRRLGLSASDPLRWKCKRTGGIDWAKLLPMASATVAIGVEIQFSGRSDLMIVDVAHLREGVAEGNIDVGFLIVPSINLSKFLPDRVGSFADANLALRRARALDEPIILWGLEHDGPGPALAKKRTNLGRTGG
jgi:hypothetical protein